MRRLNRLRCFSADQSLILSIYSTHAKCPELVQSESPNPQTKPYFQNIRRMAAIQRKRKYDSVARCKHVYDHLNNEEVTATKAKVKHLQQHMDKLTSPADMQWMQDIAQDLPVAPEATKISRVWDFDESKRKVLVNFDQNMDKSFWLPWNDAVRSRVKRHCPEFVVTNLGVVRFEQGRLVVNVCWSNMAKVEPHCACCFLQKFNM